MLLTSVEFTPLPFSAIGTPVTVILTTEDYSYVSWIAPHNMSEKTRPIVNAPSEWKGWVLRDSLLSDSQYHSPLSETQRREATK